jgi:hypothetical protein
MAAVQNGRILHDKVGPQRDAQNSHRLNAECAVCLVFPITWRPNRRLSRKVSSGSMLGFPAAQKRPAAYAANTADIAPFPDSGLRPIAKP